jgi:hypothetical protein
MNWNFTANSPDELAKIGHKLLNAARQSFLDEQWQMTRLLETMSLASIFEFPVRVRHTGVEGVPDFQVESGGRRIAIELTKIAVQDVEHARGLQRKGMRRTLGISSLYLKKSKPRTVDEVIKEGFSNQPFRFGVSPKELNEIWIKAVANQLNEKTVVLQRKEFEHGHEDWLVLLDRIGTDEFEIKSRIEAVKDLLVTRWKKNWYLRVFVQQIEFYPFLAVFDENGFTSIPKNFERPTHNYPPGFIFSGTPED